MPVVSKRLIGALCCRDGLLVKSYGYQQWRPSVSLDAALRTLDRWQLDEIVVLDISRRNSLDTSILNSLKSSSISTPIAYGGGIRTEADIDRLLKVGCDRFVLESLLFENLDLVGKMVENVGRQAIIGSLPLTIREEHVELWRPNGPLPIDDPSKVVTQWTSDFVAEVLVSSTQSEGKIGCFPMSLPSLFSEIPENSVIWFGGIDSNHAKTLLEMDITSAVAVGNILHEKENSMTMIRDAVLKRSKSQLVRGTRS
jgi:imidazole glycerol-phosphate synthase subunit HisF